MNAKEQCFVSAVVYVRNNEDVIEGFLKNIGSVLDGYFSDVEIICVNDASSDNSMQIIKKTAEIIAPVNVITINYSDYHGRETSMQSGTGISIGDFVYEFDVPYADIPADDIIGLYKKATEGYDIVSAASGHNIPLSSRMFYKIFNRFGKAHYDLRSEYFRLISRRALNRIESQNKVIPYRKVAYASCGLKSASVPASCELVPPKVIYENSSRRSLAVNSLLMFTNAGFVFSLIMTLVMMALMIVIAVYAIVTKINGLPVEGWTSIVLIVAFGFFGIFGILTVVIKYLQILVDINIKDKTFTYESVEK